MAAIPIAKLGSAIVKMKDGKAYLARRSYPTGVTPEHLVTYAKQLATAANECEAEMDHKGIARKGYKVVNGKRIPGTYGNGSGERGEAFRGCIIGKTRTSKM